VYDGRSWDGVVGPVFGPGRIETVKADGVRELSADAVIHTGGWHPRYARVLLIEHDDRVGVILIDGNGDGAELELEYWHRDDDLWHGGATAGHGPLAFLPTFQAWNAGDFVAAIGRTRPGAAVSVDYGNSRYRRQASELGIWGFVHAADSPDSDELPTVVVQSPLTP
jgi:hypothetical protein